MPRTASDKVLRDKALNVARNSKYDGNQRGHASMACKLFDKKSTGAKTWGGASKSEIMPNRQLGEELYKPIIRKFEKQKVYSSAKDNIWGTDLADMQLISKFSKGFQFFLCVIDIYRKHEWVFWKSKEVLQLLMLLKKFCLSLIGNQTKYG